jgi:dolichol-phosphate mannosyltransferase
MPASLCRRNPAAETGVGTLVSIIVPCFNEEESIEETHRRLLDALGRIDSDVEIIYIDDGSRDRTLAILRALQASDPRVRVLAFSRNFGHQIAVTAGMDAARGDAAVIVDADLQDPPSVIVEMVALWRQGYDVVYGRRTRRDGETAFKRATAKQFYRVLNALSEVPIPLDTGDFRLLSRAVLDAMKSMREHDRFIRGMVSWVGFRQIELPYERAPRYAGTSKYPFWKMVRFATDGIISFSIEPLRLASWIGVAAAGLGFIGIVYALIARLFTSNWVSGWTLLFVAILLMGGIQLLMLGILGEYVGRIYRSSKDRPLYIVSERHGFDDGERQT